MKPGEEEKQWIGYMTSINLNYVHSNSIGYGRYGVNLANELQKMGITVYDDLPSTDPAFPADEHGDRTPGKSHVVAWISVPTHARGWYRSQYPVMSTMWEARILPPSFRQSLHEFEQVIVPSHHNVELFSQYHDNVKLVPLGVDPNIWHYSMRKEPQTFFNFMIGGSGVRKGTDLAHKAFRKLWGKEGSWGDGPIPKLIFKSPRGEDYYGNRVEMVSGRISAAAEVTLYEQAHCYLQPSRGEGFGLQPLQALAQGCPTILTAAHGHDSFSHLGYGVSATPSKAAYFIYGDAGDWWEPDLDELCDHMKWVYENYGEACGDAFTASRVIANEFTWQQTAEKFVEAIGREKLETPYEESDWYVPEQKRYLVITNQDWHCNIAGTDLQFKRGREFWEQADVKRILFEAGLLDPQCLTGADIGLTPHQVERIPNYTAAHSTCAVCGQKLNMVKT